MDDFSHFLERLKHVLRVSKDSEVAAALGLKKTAFGERKRRGSVPVAELRDLALQRPELGIDVQWVLTGRPLADMVRSPQAAERQDLLNDVEQTLIDNYRAASAEGQETLRRQAQFAAAYHRRQAVLQTTASVTPTQTTDAAREHADGPTTVVVHGSLGQQVRGTAHVGAIKVGGPMGTKGRK